MISSEHLNFTLDQRLAASTHLVGSLDLCEIRLMDDTRFPWLVLIPRLPRLPRLIEIFELPKSAQHELFDEVMIAAGTLKSTFHCDKTNIAQFGNLVEQLHIHVIARTRNDAAWPQSAVGYGKAAPYPCDEHRKVVEHLQACLPIKKNLKAASPKTAGVPTPKPLF